MKRSITALLIGCILASATVGVTAEATLPPLLSQGLNKLNQLHGFSAIFSQTITYQNGSKNHYSGTIAVQRPGKFRWHYTKPYAQTYVSDGTTIWHYEPDLMQAVRMQNLGTIDPVAMQLLDGRIHPKDVLFIREVPLVSNLEDNRGSMRDFAVRIDHGMALTLTLDRHGTLVAVTHSDLLGNNNHIALSNIQSIPQDEAQFHFVPPKGVDIIIEGE